MKLEWPWRIILALLLFTGIVIVVLNVVPVLAEPRQIRVPQDYPTIQAAINAASPNDIILVSAGTYHEQVGINKTVSLIGENRSSTIIDGSGINLEHLVAVSANNVVITGFTIQNAWYAMYIGSHNCSVNLNIFRNNNVAVELYQSERNTLTNNTAANNVIGFELTGFSNGNIVEENDLINNTHLGILLDSAQGTSISRNNISKTVGGAGIRLSFSSDNIISSNSIGNSESGIYLEQSYPNPIISNNITDNTKYGIYSIESANVISGNSIVNNGECGIFMVSSQNNAIFHNNLINNTVQVNATRLYANTWDDGYPSGGNYWSDYTGVDFHEGPYQNETGSDGVGDTPYSITTDNVDRYPLMSSDVQFEASWNSETFAVDVVSNSTVSDFYFSQPQKLVGFNVTGLNNTQSFVRVIIPKDLLQSSTPDQWIVLVNGKSTNRTVWQDNRFSGLYFTYGLGGSARSIQIMGTQAIPEFTIALIPLLVIVLTLIAATQVGKKDRRKS